MFIAELERRAQESCWLRLGDGESDIALGGERTLLQAFAREVAPHFGPSAGSGGARWSMHLSSEPLGDAGPGESLVLAHSQIRTVTGDVRMVKGWRIVRNHRSKALVAMRDGVMVVGPEHSTDCCDLIPDACSALRALARGRDEHAGGALIHAACAAFNGSAVLIVGDKGRGKSTLLAALLAGGGAYIAGDRTMVRSGAGALVGAGCIDPLRLGEPALSILGLGPGTQVLGSKRVLSASDLRDCCGVSLLRSARLTLVATVAWGKALANGAALSEALLTPHDPTYPDWLAVRPERPSAVAAAALRQLPRLDLCGPYLPEEAANRVLARLEETR